MEDKKQTAVEWLASKLKDFPHIKHSQLFKDLVNQAKAMEKQQIIDAYETAMETDIYNEPLKIGKDYYNETFKSE